jgi:hypothetical protein
MQNSLIGRHDTFEYRATWQRGTGGWVLWDGRVYRAGLEVAKPSGSLLPRFDSEDEITAAVRLGVEIAIDTDKWRWR